MTFSPSRLARTASVLALMLAAGALAPVFAQDAAPAAEAPAAEAAAPVSPDTVVATVGGEPITEADLSFAAEDLTQELGQMPPEQRKPFLLRVLIDMKVMAKAGRDAGMADTPLFQQRLNYLEERALRRAFFAETIANSVTEAAVRADYDKFVAEFVPSDEIRASHILVADEAEANAKDFVLNKIMDPRRRQTLIARKEDGPVPRYVLDIHLQGDKETVFFDF